MSTRDEHQPDESLAALSASDTPGKDVEKENIEKGDIEKEDMEKQDNNDPVTLEQTASKPTDYPKGPKLGMLLLSIYLSVLLVALDRTIIATALPQITDHFNSFADVGWYNAAFLLPTTAFQLFFGRLYTFYSPKWIFLTLIFIFEVGSAICGAAPNSITLIWGRAVAGLAAGGISNGAMILMMYAAPLSKRAFYTGLMGAVFGVASVTGPLLGGVFTTKVSWRWCFYINLPIGAAVLVFLFFVVEDTPAALASLTAGEKIARLDIYGTIIFVPCIICLLLVLQWGGQKYAWSDSRIIVLLILFAALLIVFICIQVWQKESATVPPRIAKNRTVTAGAFYNFSLGSSFMMVVYYLSIWFQAIKGNSAITSGYSTLPLILSLVVSSILSGALVSKIGYCNPVSIASAILAPIGAGLLSLFRPNTGYPIWLGIQVLFGFSVGLGLQQTTILVQAVLDKKDAPTGISLVFFGQGLGGTISVAIGQNIVDNRLISGLSSFGINGQEIINGGATQLKSMFNEQQLSEVLVVYNHAIITVFYTAAAFASASILGAAVMEWRNIKTSQGKGKKDAPA